MPQPRTVTIAPDEDEEDYFLLAAAMLVLLSTLPKHRDTRKAIRASMIRAAMIENHRKKMLALLEKVGGDQGVIEFLRTGDPDMIPDPIEKPTR